ncbi:glycosyltransferase family protein [Marinobacter halotolerans]|uniref:glycosyltransferase family 4 protein n=1 Tax=Marinobacter halotolerans TaxID=1569211 RepID=UPI001244C421|nr:glycosyltransferase family 4 protein [Marinobacter halotolerans]
MKNLRIAIITYNWPPRNAIGTHRPYAWARYWSEAGASVTILTANKQLYDEPLDLDLPPIEGVKVIEVIGSTRLKLIKKVLNFDAVRTLAKKIKNWVNKRSIISIDPRLSWRYSARPIAGRLALDVDLVVSTYGPAASHLIGYDMKVANPELFWVADYRDLWSQNHLTVMSRQNKELSRDTEMNTVATRADLLSAVSKDMGVKLRDLTGKEVLYVPNGFDVNENSLLDRFSTLPVKPSGPMRIVYTGMIYEGHRDPTPLLKALVELHSDGLISTGEVTIDFYGSRADLAARLAENMQYAPFIRLKGHVSREEALLAQRSAGILLLLESTAPEARGVLTGKLFEYIASGKPILCIGSQPDYEIGGVLRQTGTGSVVGPSQFPSLKALVLDTLQGNGLYDQYKPNLTEILKYSRRTQAIEFFETLREKLKDREV